MIRADMVFNDAVAVKPNEAARQVKMESATKGSFQRTLQRKSQPQDQSRATLSIMNSQTDSQGNDATTVSAGKDAKSTSETEGISAAVLLTVMVPPEAVETELTETEAAVIDADSAPVPQPVVEPDASPQNVFNGLDGKGPIMAAKLETAAVADDRQSVPLSEDQEMITTRQIPAAKSSMNTGLSPEGLISEGLEQNATTQTTASPTTKESSRWDSLKQSSLPSDVLNDSAANQTKPANQENQTVKELAEFEIRRLNGQRTSIIQPSPSAEHSQLGTESQSDHNFYAARAEGTAVKFPGLNSQMVNKAEIPMTDVDTPDVMSQIVRKAELMLKLNSSQMKIELHPEFLGKLTIKVVVEDGAVTARFITDNHQVKQMLEANLGILRQTLESQGMRVERAEVDVQLNNGGLFDGSEGQREWNWDHQYYLKSAGASLEDHSIYDTVPDYLPEESALAENYGIQTNGSFNYLV